MTATKNQYMQQAAETMYRLTQEEKIRLQCEARERYYRDQRTTQHKMAEMHAAIRKKDTIIRERDDTIQQMGTTLREKDAEIELLRAALEKSKAK